MLGLFGVFRYKEITFCVLINMAVRSIGLISAGVTTLLLRVFL